MTKLKRTALYDMHIALGAKIVPFAGFEMPVQYEGIIAEHNTVRESVGLFDLSHMGEFIVSGAGALDFLQRMTTNDVAQLEPGDAQYTAMLTDSGGVVDDLVLCRLSDRFLLVVNAANIAKDFQWLISHLIDNVDLRDESDRTALVAIQGPNAEAVSREVLGIDLSTMGYYKVASMTADNRDIVFSRTGYTGEDGFEIYAPPDLAPAIWDAALSAGAPHGIVPVGLGARDTLRLEMKFALYGNDIDETTNPLEAGLSWIVKLDKNIDFIGRKACLDVKEDKPKRRLVAFTMNDGGIPRHGYEIAVNGEVVGTITSGGHSPSLGIGIGLGYVPAQHAKVGTSLEILIRSRRMSAQIVKPPFYKKASHK